jgi:D-alanyl-D-alanine carboxypeptidase
MYLKTRGAKEHLSSLSLAVSFGEDQPTITVTSGTTTYGGSTPVSPTSLYQIGSNTKAFTAIAILQLEAKGKLSIDAPIGKYLPQYPAYAKLTLRRLLNMTGGLESYDNLPSWETSFADHPMADVSADALIRSVYPRIKYPPGSKYYYSNTGYLIAQEVVAALSDSKSFSVEIARIVHSVGLKHTFYSSNLYPPEVAHNVVAGYYDQDDKGLQPLRGKNVSAYSVSWAQGAGSMLSTPADLVAWARALYSGTTLLPAKQRAELMSLISTKTAKPLAKPTAGDPAGFGLGVAQRYDPKMGTFWFYQGETLGFRASHLYFPNSGLVVAIFANSRPVEKESHMPQLFAKLYATIKKDGIAYGSPASRHKGETQDDDLSRR